MIEIAFASPNLRIGLGHFLHVERFQQSRRGGDTSLRDHCDMTQRQDLPLCLKGRNDYWLGGSKIPPWVKC